MSKRKPKKLGDPLDPPANDCCTPAMTALSSIFANAASGTLIFVEDGYPVALPPPTGASTLMIAPGGSGLPYWEPN